MAEMTLTQAENLDRILTLLLERHDKYAGGQTSTGTFAHKLDMYEEEVDDLIGLLEYDISYQGNTVVKIYDGGMQKIIEATYNTTRFMDAGGVVKWFNDKLAQQDKEIVRDELERKNLENAIAEFEITKRQAASSKRQSRNSMLIAGISALIALATLLLQVFDVI